MGGWRATVLALVLLAAGCSRSVPQQAFVEYPTLEEQAKPPYAAGAEIGVDYPYVLLTHCGIKHARIDGTNWAADPVLGDANPPRGWRNPLAAGTLRLVTKDRAEFRSDGHEATFVRAAVIPESCA